MEVGRPREFKDHHLTKVALVYVRQSDPRQVEENEGSTAHQRGLAEHARRWGFPEERIVTIEDLGKTGTTAIRAGYQEALRRISLGEVGVLIGAFFSRLGRESEEWNALIRACALNDTLVAVDGRILDMREAASVFFSRIMANVAEYENAMRTEAMKSGKRAKAKVGKPVTRVPVGYVMKTWELDPDPRVQEGVRAIFTLYLELRSVGKVIRTLAERGLKLPGPKGWRIPDESKVLKTLRNVAYAGVFEYGKSATHPARERTERAKNLKRVIVPEDERIRILDHHEAYVPYEHWQEIQEILTANRKGAALEVHRSSRSGGRVLLHGLLRCGLEGGSHSYRIMCAHHDDRRQNGKRPHSYRCKGGSRRGAGGCVFIAGKYVDHVVAEAVLRRLAPASIESLRGALREAQRAESDCRHLGRLQLLEAAKKIAWAKRQYEKANPENRRVRAGYEREYEEALEEREILEKRIERDDAEVMAFDDASLHRLEEVGEDLPHLFWEVATPAERKDVLTSMVEQVLVVERTDARVLIRIRWIDGASDEEIEIRLPRYAHLVAAELRAQGLGPTAIARKLNELGYRTRNGKQWIPQTVAQVLPTAKLERRSHGPHE